MADAACAAHPAAVAGFRCDGCGRALCEACVQESHALLLCRHCGERALPTGADAPATVAQRRAVEKVAGAADYGLADAFLYPFRGSGLAMFAATSITALVVTGLVRFVLSWGIGCLAITFAVLLWLGWIALLVGMQFKIVVSTARYDAELPDWPEYHSWGERVVELLSFVAIAAQQYGPLLLYVLLFTSPGLVAAPSFPFWLGAAAMAWLGTALGVMAWGAAGVHWRHLAVRSDLHLRALAATGRDGLATVNLAFVLFGLVFVLKGLLARTAPLAGNLAAGLLAIYWAFLLPHLVGLLFRRHRDALTAVYEG